MLLKSLLLFFVGGLNVLIGLLVLLRGYRKVQNWLFCIFSVSLGGWVIGIGSFLISDSPAVAFTWAKLYYSFPLIIAATMPLFAKSFPGNFPVTKRWWYPITAGYVALALPLAVLPHFLTTELVYHDWGKEILLDKRAYLAYSVYLLLCFTVGLGHTYLKSKVSHGLAKRQLQFFFTGFILTSFFGIYFNLILPWFGNYRLIWIGPLFTNAFIIATGYSILKHRMFDVRFVVVRSLVYLLSLVSLATVYGFFVFGIANIVFNLRFPVSIQILLSAATGIAALSFNQFRKIYDKATNRLFYQDNYDAQAFFDELNKTLVSTLDLNLLLQRVTSIITKHLNVQYALVGVKDTKTTRQRVIGTDKRSFPAHEVAQVRKLTPHLHETVIIADDIPSEYNQLRYLLLKNDVAVLARLTTNPRITQEGLGYIVLGRKKSGNPYTLQDSKVVEAVANELVVAIQNALHYEEIERFNETLQQKIDDATRKLRRTNEKLRLLDETKDDFISMASHQLRTPLTSVKGYVSMVLDSDAGKINDMQRRLLSQAFISAQRMVYLISDLLNVSRLRTGKFMVEPSPTNLANVIRGEIEQLTETAESRNLTLTYRKPEHFPVLMLDETKMRQVIMNFIDNAIYYTPSGGHITVNLVEKPQTVEFTVTDTGIGVPKAEQHHLFSKFYRANNAVRARPDGTGLGLFMAKKVIVAQGGATVFKSQEGKGSTFGFSFAKSRLLPSQQPAAIHEPQE